MPYSQNLPKYDAHQWTSGMTAADFGVLVDPGGNFIWSINTDGSLHFDLGGFDTGDIPLNSWIVSTPYWSTLTWYFPNTVSNAPGGNYAFTNTEFNEQFTVIG